MLGIQERARACVSSGRRRTRNHVGDKVSGYCVSDRAVEPEEDRQPDTVGFARERERERNGGRCRCAKNEEGSTPEKRSFPDSNFIVQGSTWGSLCEQLLASSLFPPPPVLNMCFYNKLSIEKNCKRINLFIYIYRRRFEKDRQCCSSIYRFVNKKAGREDKRRGNEKGEQR